MTPVDFLARTIDPATSSPAWVGPGRFIVRDVTPEPPDPGVSAPGRLAWTRGTRPSRTNRGWEGIGSPTLTPYTVPASKVVTTSNLTLVNRELSNDVDFTGDNVHLIGCKGGRISFLGSDCSATDCTMTWVSCSGGKRITYDRCVLTAKQGEDSVHVTSDTRRVEDFTLRDSYIGIVSAFNAGQHADGLQQRGADRTTILGNYFDFAPVNAQGDYYNHSAITAAIYLENGNGGNHTALIQGNWLRSGGAYVVNLTADGLGVYDNIFYNVPGSTPIYTGQTVTAQADNVRVMADGSTVPLTL